MINLIAWTYPLISILFTSSRNIYVFSHITPELMFLYKDCVNFTNGRNLWSKMTLKRGFFPLCFKILSFPPQIIIFWHLLAKMKLWELNSKASQFTLTYTHIKYVGSVYSFYKSNNDLWHKRYVPQPSINNGYRCLQN